MIPTFVGIVMGGVGRYFVYISSMFLHILHMYINLHAFLYISINMPSRISDVIVVQCRVK